MFRITDHIIPDKLKKTLNEMRLDSKERRSWVLIQLKLKSQPRQEYKTLQNFNNTLLKSKTTIALSQ